MSGIDSTGFTPALVTEIVPDLETSERSAIDPAFVTAPDQPIGQINGIFAEKLAELWELVQVAYEAFDRSKAEGQALSAIGLLTGTVGPRAATFGLCSGVNVTLIAGATLPAGSIANVAGQPLNRWAAATTTVNSGGSSATFQVDFICLAQGPIVANAGTLNVISAPVFGWSSVSNPIDAAPGLSLETDTQFRIRQEDELSQAGSGTVDSIRAALLEVAGVQQVQVFENTTLVTDSTGLPGKAVECVVFDGLSPAAANDALAQTVWDNKPAGIQAFGSSSGSAVDSQGVTRTVAFSRPVQKTVWLEFDLTVDAARFVGAAAVKSFIAAKARATQNLDVDVISALYIGAVLEANGGPVGVLDCTGLRLGFSSSPVSTTNLVIGSREIAVFDTSRILVNGA